MKNKIATTIKIDEYNKEKIPINDKKVPKTMYPTAIYIKFLYLFKAESIKNLLNFSPIEKHAEIKKMEKIIFKNTFIIPGKLIEILMKSFCKFKKF